MRSSLHRACVLALATTLSGIATAGVPAPAAAATADLAATLTDVPDPILLGGSLTYTLTVANGGPGAASGVVATLALPATAGVASVTSSQGTCDQWGFVTCALGTVASAGSATVTVVAVPAASGTITATATVTGTSTDPVATNNKATATTVVNTAPAVVRFSVATYSVVEGTASATITVSRTGPSNVVFDVDYAVAAGTATLVDDYQDPAGGATGTLHFTAGVLSRTILIPIVNDTVDEASPETVLMSLGTPTADVPVVLGTPVAATLNIVDNDAGGALRFSMAAMSVSEATMEAHVVVTRSGGAASAVTVDYATSDGTATAGSDYTAASGTLTFAAGALTADFMVPILPNGVADGARTFGVTLSNPTGGATLGTPAATTVTIVDDEVAARFGAASYTVNEGVASATLTVLRQGPSTLGFSVDYAITPGTAVLDTDYRKPSGTTGGVGTLTFPAGTNSRTIVIPLVNNTLDQPSPKTVGVALANPTNGALVGSPGTATLNIVDDDGGGIVRFGTATYSVTEGGTASMTVARSGVLGAGATIGYTITPGSATETDDYQLPGGLATGTLTFAAGATSRTIPIPAVNDLLDEPAETFTVTLGSPGGGAALGLPATATVSIADNDLAGAMRFAAATSRVSEARPAATLTVTRTSGSNSTASVNWTITGGTAAAGVDFTGPTSGTLTFTGTATSATIMIPLVNDPDVEGDETIVVALSGPTNAATLGTPATATLTIADDEVLLQFSALAYSVSEGAAAAVLTVTRSGPSSVTVSVPFTVTAGSATLNVDYRNPAGTTAGAGTLVFVAGTLSRTISVPVINDTLVEGATPETLVVALGSPTTSSSSVVGLGPRDTATISIVDNDAGGALRFSAPAYRFSEPAGATPATATITITRSGGVASGVTVDYMVSPDTATAGTDYTATSGTLNFGPGVLSRTFTIPILHDTVDEPNETVHLMLDNATGGATLATPNEATLVIVDNDVGGTVQFAAASYTAREVTGSVRISVVRAGGSASGVTVAYTTVDGTAQAGSDYTATSGTLTFGPGLTTQFIDVPILSDAANEPAESFQMRLSSPTGGGTVGTPATATVTIARNRPVLVSWAPSRERAVKGPGGGYRVYYSRTSGFSVASAPFVEVPFEAGVTSARLDLDPGTYYLRVVAYSALERSPGAGGSVSAPSAQVSVTVP